MRSATRKRRRFRSFRISFSTSDRNFMLSSESQAWVAAREVSRGNRGRRRAPRERERGRDQACGRAGSWRAARRLRSQIPSERSATSYRLSSGDLEEYLFERRSLALDAEHEN